MLRITETDTYLTTVYISSHIPKNAIERKVRFYENGSEIYKNHHFLKALTLKLTDVLCKSPHKWNQIVAILFINFRSSSFLTAIYSMNILLLFLLFFTPNNSFSSSFKSIKNNRVNFTTTRWVPTPIQRSHVTVRKCFKIAKC